MMNRRTTCVFGFAATVLAAFSPSYAQYIQKLAYTYSGDGFAERFGISVALSGGSDVDGDGYFDIGVGAPFHGEVVQYDGSVAICSTAGTPSDNASCGYSWHGSDAQERFGHGLSTDGDLNGDLDGDGIGDVVIGAPRALVSGVSKGVVSVYVSAPGYCDGDANADSAVDSNDISYVIFRLGNSGAPGIPGDVNVDAVVDVNDLSFVIARFGSSCP